MPPSPAFTRILTSSINIEKPPAVRKRRRLVWKLLARLLDCGLMLTNLPMRPRSLNSTMPVTLANKRVVLAPADVDARLDLGAALAHDDASRPEPTGRRKPSRRAAAHWNRARFWNCLNLFYVPYFTYTRMSPTFTSVKDWRCPMVFLYCFLRLNLKTMIFVAAAVADDGGLHACRRPPVRRRP